MTEKNKDFRMKYKKKEVSVIETIEGEDFVAKRIICPCCNNEFLLFGDGFVWEESFYICDFCETVFRETLFGKLEIESEELY